jgi:hypothetical protein
MTVGLEEAKSFLRIESSEEDTLIENFICAAEDIVCGVLRFPLEELEGIPEVIRQGICYAVAQFYEKRESMDVIALMNMLRGMLSAYRKEAW